MPEKPNMGIQGLRATHRFYFTLRDQVEWVKEGRYDQIRAFQEPLRLLLGNGLGRGKSEDGKNHQLTIAGDTLKNGKNSGHSQGVDNTDGEKQLDLREIQEADKAW